MGKVVKSVVRALPQIAIAFAVTWATGGLSAAYWAAAAVAASAAVSGALTKTPKLSGLDRARTLTLSSGAAPQSVIYGQTRVPTVRVFAASSPDGYEANGYLHQVLALARTDADGVEDISDVWFNDQILPLTASGNGFVPEPWHPLAGAVYIEKLSGAAGQEAPALLVDANVGWTHQHRLQGIAALYVRLRWDKQKGADVWPTGLPQISATVKGQKVQDPRTGTKAWTDNFALCVRDFLLAGHGYGCAPSEVDEPSMIAAANLSDEDVILDAGGSQKRYTVNTALYLDGAPGDIVEQALGAGMATLAYTRGVWRLDPAAYRAAPIGGLVLTADHLRDAPTIDMAPPRESRCNRVTGRYMDPTTWQATDFPQVEDSALIAEDGEILERDIDLPSVTDAARAQRLAKIELRRSRRGIVQWPGNWACLTLRVGDAVPVTLAQLGWTAKLFRVESWELAAEGGINLTLREEVAADYAWTAAEEQAAAAPAPTNLPDPVQVAAPSGLVAVAATRQLADGSVAPAISVTIVPSVDAQVRDHLVRYRSVDVDDWLIAPVPSGAVRIDLPVPDNATYVVAAAAQSARGVTSAWTASQIVAVTGGITGARVVGLELFGQGVDAVWEGRDVRIVWRGSFPDTAADFGDEPYGAETAQANPYWAGYVVRVYDPDTGALLRTERPQTATDYTYGYDANMRDGGPRRRLRFAVSIAPKIGAELGTATLTVSNPAPGLPAGLVVEGVTLGVRIAYTPAPDSDWRGILVYMGDTLPLPADAAHLAYRGPDTDITLPLPAGAERWVRVAQVDAFGDDVLDLTSPVQVTALSVLAADLAEQIIGEDQLTDVLKGRIDLVDGPADLAGSVAARVQAEAVARVAAVAAEATARGTAITNEATTRQAQNTALASQISTVSAVADGAVADIATEQTARIDADGALATSISTVVAQVNHVTTGLPAAHAAVGMEATARANADTAIAGTITTLSAQVNHVTTGLPAAHAAVGMEATARANADTAIAGTVTTLSAQVNHVTTGLPAAHAAVGMEATARANADTAIAGTVTTLTTTVGGHTSTLSTQATSIGGLSAQYTVKVDVNGKVAGFGLASEPIDGATVSHFAVVSDKFTISLPGETTNRPIFSAGTHPVTGASLVSINGALYAGVITADQLIGGTVTAAELRVGATYTGAKGVYIRANDGGAGNQTVFAFDGVRRRAQMYRRGDDAGFEAWDSGGKLIFSSQGLEDETVGTRQIVPGSITNSAQSSATSISVLGAGWTNAGEVTITHNGARVRLEVSGAGTVITNATLIQADLDVRLLRGGSEIAYWPNLVYKNGIDYLDDVGVAMGSLAVTYIDDPPGTSSTYQVQINRNGGQGASCAGVRLLVTALYTES